MSDDKFLGLECQLFDWQDWDEDGPMCCQFYDVTLRASIGEFPIGHKFALAYFDGTHSRLSLQDADGTQYTFNLILATGSKVEE